MKPLSHFLLLLALMSCSLGVLGQSELVQAAGKMKPDKDFENVLVRPLMTDAHASSFLIWIKNEVRLHKHEEHSEHVLVLKGKGTMTLGDREFLVKKGDMVFIPEGTPHAVVVKGGVLKVISIQSPEFKGKDRIFLD